MTIKVLDSMIPDWRYLPIISIIFVLLKLKMLSSCALVFHSSPGVSELLTCSICKALIQSELFEPSREEPLAVTVSPSVPSLPVVCFVVDRAINPAVRMSQCRGVSTVVVHLYFAQCTARHCYPFVKTCNRHRISSMDVTEDA